MTRDHYEELFTRHFNLKKEDYVGKEVLDVGCGPRGSLEWAEGTVRRIGLDPLAEQYRVLGTDLHSMRYVAAPAEQMPFLDSSFDIVSSFNSLDHVENVPAVAKEIIRVLKPGGMFLLLTDVGHAPTVTEPATFGWEVVDLFAPPLVTEFQNRYEKSARRAIYRSLRNAIPYNSANTRKRYGVLHVLLRKPE